MEVEENETMRISTVKMQFPLIFNSACLSLLILAVSAPAAAQPQNWWEVQPSGIVEHGKLDEIKTMRNVYVQIVFNRPGTGQITSETEQADIRRNVIDAFRARKDLTVVAVPEQADFAVILRTTVSVPSADNPRHGNFSVVLDQDEEVSVEAIVMVPRKMPDGTFRPRFVWENYSPNVQAGAIAGSRFVVEGFLSELKNLRERK
jgi:hypothetical protein